MKQILHGEYLLQEVPEESKDFMITNAHTDNDLIWWEDFPEGRVARPVVIVPPGNWTIIGKGDELTEEDWRGIVDNHEKFPAMYKDYVNGDTARSLIASGISLLKSHSMKPETTLILKKTE